MSLKEEPKAQHFVAKVLPNAMTQVGQYSENLQEALSYEPILQGGFEKAETLQIMLLWS